MARKLFCEISPLTYEISSSKERLIRYLVWTFDNKRYANKFCEDKLPILVYKNNSLIRRTLGNVDSVLQNNKAITLGIAAPKVNEIIIEPGETFSFWKLVGKCTKKKKAI